LSSYLELKDLFVLVKLKTPESIPEGTSRRARSVHRIMNAAASIFGGEGFEKASMLAVAKAAGVSKGLLHYHFRSKDHLLIETQRSIFKQIHLRFEERFKRGDQGMDTALDALDALWDAMLDMRPWAPFMVETMSLATQQNPIREHLEAFYQEAETLLEKSITKAFAEDIERMTVPPRRLTQLIRTCFLGLLVELAQAKTAVEIQVIDDAFHDFRKLFAQVALEPQTQVALTEGPS
jgi:AcrR family transcriptional regulator